jgi:hypothetical protein
MHWFFTSCLVTALALPIGAQTVLLNDTFSDGAKNDQDLTGSAAWYLGAASGVASSVVAGELVTTRTGTTGVSHQLTAFYTSSGVPQVLWPGTSISLSFRIYIASGAGITAAQNLLRFGLFNSGGNRISIDTTLVNGDDTAFNNWLGYSAWVGVGTGSSVEATLRERTSANTTLFSSAANSTLQTLGATTPVALNTYVTGKLTLTNNGTTLGYGGSIGSYNFSGADATPSTTNFDSVALFISSAALSSGGHKIDDVTVTVFVPPAPPLIAVQPTNTTVVVGNNAAFSVSVVSSLQLGYQWYAGAGPAPINGATNATLTLTNVALNQSGSAYFVVVSNSLGSVTSAPNATLTVIPAPEPFVVVDTFIDRASNTVTLAWNSRPGTNYAIQWSTNLASNVWQDIATNLLAQHLVTTSTAPNDCSVPAGFFRIRETSVTPDILVRSSWQTVNIGDIAHSPGLIQLIRTYISNAPVTLWAGKVDRGVSEMLLTNFPTLRIVQGTINSNGLPSNTNLQSAWNRAKLLVHGSGPSIVALSDVNAWRLATGKPYGIYGVTQSDVPSGTTKTVLDGASFVYLRDSFSLTNVRNANVTSPVVEFAPDGSFGLALSNDALATNYLVSKGLTDKQFLCVIPRLRYTPYWLIDGSPYDADRDAYNETWKEVDHAKLRECIIQWVRQTGQKVLCCPEMTYQVDIIPELLINPLPEDVRTNVVWRSTYWITDEAASVYARASAVVSFECHSPIIALGKGTPAIYLRQPTDSIKGQMYRDIGLPQWIMEIDSVTGADIAARALEIYNNPSGAQAYLTNAMSYVQQRQAQTLGVVRDVYNSP